MDMLCPEICCFPSINSYLFLLLNYFDLKNGLNNNIGIVYGADFKQIASRYTTVRYSGGEMEN